MENYISYYRVSTQKQGLNGFGMGAQRTLINNYVKRVGGTVVSEYKEVFTGKKHNRLELNKAISECEETGAKLIIAKLDRLSREEDFISILKKSRVKFICADMPDANDLTISIFAAIAEHEGKNISLRIKQALAEKKRRGEKMGSPQNLTDKSRLLSIESRKEKAVNNENNQRAVSMIISLKKQNLSLRQIADHLNKNNFKTSKNNKFYFSTVAQLLKTNNLYITSESE